MRNLERYRYISAVVYNNFPWPVHTDKRKSKIAHTVKVILTACDLYPDSSLADLYNEVLMPPELRTAHQNNDRSVMEIYDFKSKDSAYKSKSACVAELMKLYNKLIEK